MNEYPLLSEFLKASGVVEVTQLAPEQAMELQDILKKTQYYQGQIDGLIGAKTIEALARFKKDNFLEHPTTIGKFTVSKLFQIRDKWRSLLPEFNSTQRLDTQLAVIAECSRQGITSISQQAYILATVEHETAQTWRPVKESFWNSETWREKNLRYFPFYGRGYVQLTWKSNYQKYSDITGYDLVSNPDQAMIPNVALFILVHGCRHGTFTGHPISRFINKNKVDLINARRVINWLDKAETIAAIAKRWEGKLEQRRRIVGS